MRARRKRWLVLALITVLVAALVPSYLRAYSISGDSDAPAYATGDRVLVNLAAYDLRTPYSDRPLMRLQDPKPGDMVLFRIPAGGLAVKRVVAGPGTRVGLRGNRLEVDGRPLRYRAVPDRERARVARGSLGSLLELEEGNGPPVYVSYTPGLGELRDLDTVEVPRGSYFLLGSNRDRSVDSRVMGPVPRGRILGRVIAHGPAAGK